MSDPLRSVLLPKLDGVKTSGGAFMARCPAHEDNRQSLSITQGRDKPVLLHCHAGCQPEDILSKLGLAWTDLRNGDDESDRGEWTPNGPAVDVYDYHDEHGTLLFQVLRTADKRFSQRRPDPTTKSGWSWKLADTRRVLYRLPALLKAIGDGRRVWVVEGERDVHTLERLDEVATTSPGGAGKWRDEYSESLKDAHVTIVADRDDPGRLHARAVMSSLDGIAATVRIVEAVVGKDTTDHINGGRTVDDFEVTASSDEEDEPELAPDLWEFIATDDPPYDWTIPDLLERGDRLIWTGGEGLGKSMFVRQLAVMAAAGLHPFDPERGFHPQRVLLIDCENSERQSRNKFRPLAEASRWAGRRVPDGGLRLIHRPRGINIASEMGAMWLRERVKAHQPDILVIGPFYRLHLSDMNEEAPARLVTNVLDEIRTTVDCSLVLEAHSGHAKDGLTRSVRPIGSSLLLRWPEFGYGIMKAENPHGSLTCGDVHQNRDCPEDKQTKTVDVKAWRGPRDEREWPDQLTWGAPWPWVPANQG